MTVNEKIAVLAAGFRDTARTCRQPAHARKMTNELCAKPDLEMLKVVASCRTARAFTEKEIKSAAAKSETFGDFWANIDNLGEKAKRTKAAAK